MWNKMKTTLFMYSVLQAEPKWCKRTQCSEIMYKTKFLSLYMFAEKQVYRFCKQPPKLHISYEVVTLTTSCLTALRQLESTRHTNNITLGEAVSRCERYSLHCCRWAHSSEQCILLYMFLFAYIHAVPGFMYQCCSQNALSCWVEVLITPPRIWLKSPKEPWS